MKLAFLVALCLLTSSCNDGEYNRRAYVISQSHLDAEPELPIEQESDH